MPRTTESCDLSAIIGVWPEDDHRCTGIAKTQHRRCLLTTNAHNRSMAYSLIEEGSALLASGEECIDEILEELAPLTLCVRWHQYQAAGLASQWREKVNKFVQRRSAGANTRTRPSSRRPTSTDHREDRSAYEYPSAQILLNQQNIFFINFGPVHFGSDGLAGGTAAPSPSASRPNTAFASPATTRAISATRSAMPTSQMPLVRTTQRPTNPTPSYSAQQLVPTRNLRTTPPITTSRTAPRDIPVTAAPSSTASTQRRVTAPMRRTTTTTRRPIEGDCEICYLPLIGGHDEEDTSDSDSDYEEATSSTNNRREPLVWCKVQCGHNFHKSCMDPWLASCAGSSRTATCPTCRAIWRQ